MRSLFVGSLVLAVALTSNQVLDAQETTGTVRVSVYRDLDGDGVRDDGEEPLYGAGVDVRQGDVLLFTLGIGASGQSEQSLLPGSYTLNAHYDQQIGVGGRPDFTFDPMIRDGDSTIRFPWEPSPPGSISVTVTVGSEHVIDMGVRPNDVAVVSGEVLLANGFAAPGTVVRAFAGGRECGHSQVVGGSEVGYILYASGDREVPGCARRGDTVQFTVGGVAALQEYTWRRFSDPGNPALYDNVDLVAMPQHAWYWYQQSEGELPAVGTRVQAVIDGVVCGEARVEAGEGGVVGFSKLLVPSADVQPGCGREGVEVSFLVDGVPAEYMTLQWRLGVSYINPFVGPVLLPGGGPPELPDTGRAPDEGAPPLAWFAAIGGAGLLLVTFALALRRRPGS